MLRKILVLSLSAYLITGCSTSQNSSANSLKPSSSKSSSSVSSSPSNSTNVAAKIGLQKYGVDCSTLEDPKTDLLGQTLIDCPLEVTITNRSQTEFQFFCDAWLTMSNGLRYSYSFYPCQGPQIVNPGERRLLSFAGQVLLPKDQTVIQLEIGNSKGTTKFTNMDFKVPSNCKYNSNWGITTCK